MVNHFNKRKKKASKCKERVFEMLFPVNELKHSSDHNIWVNGEPIWVETKTHFLIEKKSYEEQKKILDRGYKVILVCNARKTPVACWFKDVKIKFKKDDPKYLEKKKKEGWTGDPFYSLDETCFIPLDEFIDKELRKHV